MKKLAYILTVIFLVFTSCLNESILDQGEDQQTKEGINAITFGLHIPQFSVVTKGGSNFETPVGKVEIYTFDTNGVFLGKATDVSLPDNDMRGTAIIPVETRIIHFVINSNDTRSFTPNGILKEEDIVPALETNSLGYWGRVEVTLADMKSLITVELIRNYAKISFRGDKYEGLTFAIANNPKSAKVAVFDEDDNNSFEAVENVLTIPENLAFWKYGESDDSEKVTLSNDVQFLFETENATLESGDTPTFVIAKIEDVYYKFQLILSAVEACKIERNYHYEIVFEDFELNSSGYASFKEAADADEVANDIFADIIKHSPGIMDSKNNKIEVEKLAYQMKQGKIILIPANYYVNGVVNNENVKCYVKTGSENISVSYDEGKIKVEAKINGEAIIVFADSNELLKREIKISVTDGFEFTSFEIENNEEDVTLKVGLPEGLDKAYFPLQLKIKANNIVPVEGLIIGYEEDGTSYYLYEVTELRYDFDSNQPTIIEIPFKVSLSEGETVMVDHDNFLPISTLFNPGTKLLTLDRLSYNLYGYKFGLSGVVELAYDGGAEDILVNNGKVLNSVILPNDIDEVTLTSYLNSYPFTKTLSVNNVAGNIFLNEDEVFISSSQTTQDVSLKAKLFYYRLDNGTNQEYGDNTVIQLSYQTTGGIVKKTFTYHTLSEVEIPEIPDDVEMLVLSRIVTGRVYKAIVTVEQLEQENSTIQLIYNPSYSTEKD